MPSRWAVVSAMLALAACTDSTGPDPVVDSIILDFCSHETPLWFAYQNAGGDWTRVMPSAGGSFEFDASERVAIAFTVEKSFGILTDIYYTTATELAPLSGRACVEQFGAKTLNGTVADVLTGEEAVVSMGGVEDVVFGPSTTFTLTDLPDGPQDIIAHREVGTVGSLTPDRVIVRRAQSILSGGTIPVLDFGTTTSEAVAANTATISGMAFGDNGLLDVYFHTALGTGHTLYLSPFFTSPSQTIYGVPGALTQSGDLHQLVLNVEESAGDAYRYVERWYRTPANQAIALGPDLTVPQFSGLNSSAYLRLRAQLASQADYPSFAAAYFIQGSEPNQRHVYVTTTAGHNRGTRPSVWTMEIPDFSDAGGYPSFAGLVSGNGTASLVEAFDGTLAHFIGAPIDGATIRWAGRISDVTLLRAEGTSGPDGRPSRRSGMSNRVFSRGR